MAKFNDLQINVGISISDETVQRCCQLLSIYLTDNPNKTVEVSWYHDIDKIYSNVYITTKVEDENNG